VKKGTNVPAEHTPVSIRSVRFDMELVLNFQPVDCPAASLCHWSGFLAIHAVHMLRTI
jgi:hypothetical protein